MKGRNAHSGLVGGRTFAGSQPLASRSTVSRSLERGVNPPHRLRNFPELTLARKRRPHLGLRAYVGSIPTHQQPARQSRRKGMKALAHG